jgi:hypothetical protein
VTEDGPRDNDERPALSHDRPADLPISIPLKYVVRPSPLIHVLPISNPAIRESNDVLCITLRPGDLPQNKRHARAVIRMVER